jgi:hypothetical protein
VSEASTWPCRSSSPASRHLVQMKGSPCEGRSRSAPRMVASRVCFSPRRRPVCTPRWFRTKRPAVLAQTLPVAAPAAAIRPRCSDGPARPDSSTPNPCLSLPVICADPPASHHGRRWIRPMAAAAHPFRKEHPVAEPSEMTTPPSSPAWLVGVRRQRGDLRHDRSQRGDRGNRTAPAGREGPDPDRRQPSPYSGWPTCTKGPCPTRNQTRPTRIASCLCPDLSSNVGGLRGSAQRLRECL